MFQEYIFHTAQADYEKKLLLIDKDNLAESAKVASFFQQHGFEVILYKSDLDFRIHHEYKLQDREARIAVFAKPNDYIPYDIRKRMKLSELSYARLYPRLDAETIRKEANKLDQELILRAYQKTYESFSDQKATEDFILHNAYGKENVKLYTCELTEALEKQADSANTYRDWFEIANRKANIDVISTEYELGIDTSNVNNLFCNWALTEYGKLGSILDKSSPVLISRAMEYMRDHSDKFALIVMDGMSEFDWTVLSRSFTDLHYHKSSILAMIPSVTSVSRQCLLSGKLPFQLEDPWHQAKEKTEFERCAQNNLGFKPNQIEYLRGFEKEPELFTKCCVIIIMDIDETVHGQKQGREGMFNDVSSMARKKVLAQYTKMLLNRGFDVYISADHGNTLCRGIGKMVGAGVETETKSHRMTVLKDFADKEQKIIKHHMLEYPKYYLPQEYDYLICSVGESLDPKDSEVMNHGGISLDECIVPFISLYAEENDG